MDYTSAIFIAICHRFQISEYQDEAMLIPKNTSVLIRRVPGRPRLPIVTEQEYCFELLNSRIMLFFSVMHTHHMLHPSLSVLKEKSKIKAKR